MTATGHLHTDAVREKARRTRQKRGPRPSMRAAIDAKCRECICDPLAGGTWRAQTDTCSITDCPLWELRPRVTR